MIIFAIGFLHILIIDYVFPGLLRNTPGFFIFAVGISLSNFFNCKTRPRWEIWPVFSCRPGFGRFLAILDTFGRKWYNLSSGRKYGLKTKIRPK